MVRIGISVPRSAMKSKPPVPMRGSSDRAAKSRTFGSMAASRRGVKTRLRSPRCRSWSGGPVNAFSLWKPDAVRVTAGPENIATFKKTELSHRQYCKKCGGHLMTSHPTLGLVDVFAATLPALKFSPAVHVNYAETVLPMRDGLPKQKDFPKEFGGSGETMPE